jgi:hypothetical protein
MRHTPSGGPGPVGAIRHGRGADSSFPLGPLAQTAARDAASGSTQQVGWSGPAHAAGACSRDALLLGPSDELPGRDVVLEVLACRMAAAAGDGRALLSAQRAAHLSSVSMCAVHAVRACMPWPTLPGPVVQALISCRCCVRCPCVTLPRRLPIPAPRHSGIAGTPALLPPLPRPYGHIAPCAQPRPGYLSRGNFDHLVTSPPTDRPNLNASCPDSNGPDDQPSESTRAGPNAPGT